MAITHQNHTESAHIINIHTVNTLLYFRSGIKRLITPSLILFTATFTRFSSAPISAQDLSAISINVLPGAGTLQTAIQNRPHYLGIIEFHLTSGIYAFTESIHLPAKTVLIGLGPQTILQALPAEENAPCGLVVGSDSRLEYLTLKYDHYSKRQESSATASIFILGAQNVSLLDVHIQGSASAGILVEFSNNVTIKQCSVAHTLADGIHITNASSHIKVEGCYVHDTGDDAIATVSYRQKGAQCTDITFQGNHVSQGKARAITCIGSRNVLIANNWAEDFLGGIYVAYESHYNTYIPENICVDRNEITRCGKRLGMQGLLIDSANNVIFSNNEFIACLPGFTNGSSQHPSSAINFTHNVFNGTIDNGHAILEFNNTQQLILSGNTFLNSALPLIHCSPTVVKALNSIK